MHTPSLSRRRRSVRHLALLGAVLLSTAVVGCSDDSSTASTSSTTTSTAASSGPSTLVAPAEFEQRIAAPGVVTINVHTPDEGNIDGTDLRIPYTDITTSTDLPADRSTPLAVYCRSGNMSADAVRNLAALGYTDIVELAGGFNAWKASGRLLTTP